MLFSLNDTTPWHGDRKGRHYDTRKTGRKRHIVVATLAVAMDPQPRACSCTCVISLAGIPSKLPHLHSRSDTLGRSPRLAQRMPSLKCCVCLSSSSSRARVVLPESGQLLRIDTL